ncbi:MAG TPA: glycosyltransferase [Solirubrobacteraceae bacterium]|jgi:glycosyltransferase involved in cell wall biosynthesis|nr:glycosyltransferase [Solirubrobacteraceae bacterium]
MTRLLIVYQPTDGGVGRHVRDLARGLKDRGDEIVLCGPDLPQGITDAADHRPLALERAISPRADLATAAGFARIVRAVRPDIVHAHSSKAGAIARVARLWHPRVPLLYSPHGYAFAGHFDRALERRAYRTVERLLALATTRVICVCEAEARLARSIGPPSRVRVVNNGIPPTDDGAVDSRIRELAARGPVIGALTLLRPGKGLETLIDATPQILAHNLRAQVAIVGAGPDLEPLIARAHHRGVDHAVHFLGPSDEPLSALRGMRVFVHPSWAESFPYVILEAMSLGLPIVASDIGGIGEALVNGSSGLLVAPRDPTALAHALNDLLEHPDRMAAMGAAALERVTRQFSLTAMIGHMAEVYGEVIPAPRGAAHR